MRISPLLLVLLVASSAWADDPLAPAPPIRVDPLTIVAPAPDRPRPPTRRRRPARKPAPPPLFEAVPDLPRNVTPSKVGSTPQPAPESAPATPVEPAAPAPTEVAPEVEAVPVAEEPAPSKFRFELKGFLRGRYLYALTSDGAELTPFLAKLPESRGFFEANLQPALRHERFNLVGDFTLYFSTYRPEHLVLINETYGDLRLGPVVIRAGRQRLIWGSGLAVNPTDILNPPKNPLDVQEQRMGSLLLPLVEVSTRRFAATALFSPALITNSWALPVDGDFAQSILGARLYFLALGTDINAIFYEDFGRQVTHGGGSLSHVFFDRLEVHFEGILSYGARALPPMLAPLAVAAEQAMCPRPSAAPKIGGSLVGGARLDWSDQSFLSLEYYWDGNGLEAGDFDRLRSEIACLRMLPPGTLPELRPPNPVGHPIDPALLLLRQHYVLATYQKPHLSSELLSDVSLAATAVFGVEDQSTILQLRAGYAFSGIGSLNVGAAAWLTRDEGELHLFPLRFLAFGNLRIAY